MHDVDIVSAFLQQQSAGVFLFGVPVFEICVPAVVDEVAAPAALDFADHAGINDLFHLEYGREVAHVVTDEKFAFRAVRGTQDPVTPFKGDRHGFFQIDRFAG